MAQGALKGMGAVSAGLIVATGLKLSTTLKDNPLGLRISWLFSVASFISVGILRMPLAWVLLGLGFLACWLAYHRLKADSVAAMASSLSEKTAHSEGEKP